MAEEHFKDGTLSGEGEYEDGQRHGPWTFYFRNGGMQAQGTYKYGQLWDEGEYNLGKKTGEWVTYDKAGKESKRKTHR